MITPVAGQDGGTVGHDERVTTTSPAGHDAPRAGRPSSGPAVLVLAVVKSYGPNGWYTASNPATPPSLAGPADLMPGSLVSAVDGCRAA